MALPKIGLPLWFGTIERNHERLREIITFFIDYGVKYVELSIDYPWPYKHNDSLQEMIKEITSEGIGIAIHAPWRDIHLASPVERIRKASVDEVINAIEAVLSIETKLEYIVLHVNTMQKLTIADNRRETIKAAKNSVTEILEKLREKLDTLPLLCIENLSNLFTSDIQDLPEVISDENLCLVLDVAHAYISYIRSYKDYYRDFQSFLQDLINIVGAEKINVIHFHDVSDKKKEHIIPGQGIIDYREVLKVLRKTNATYLLIEAYLDKEHKHLSLKEVLEYSREFMTWAKIYLA
ncbi:sugar phosphate isomerase/epimerase [Desulfurococcaceae archaeon MEX13E-LK6-19]|nr:sugar phosphate isomerase/epimerase [Desulfurococcaceae archaeon MEX13E-LK6-19]